MTGTVCGIITLIAFVGPFFCVPFCMCFQSVCIRSCVVTFFAFIWVFFIVLCFMSLQITLKRGRVMTLVTLKGFFADVIHHVFLKVTWIWGGIIAKFAGIRLLSTVLHHVLLQIALWSIWRTTLAALELLFKWKLFIKIWRIFLVYIHLYVLIAEKWQTLKWQPSNRISKVKVKKLGLIAFFTLIVSNTTETVQFLPAYWSYQIWCESKILLDSIDISSVCILIDSTICLKL